MQTGERLKRGRQPERSMPSKAFVFWLLILIVLIAGLLFLRSNFFTVGSVVIEGNSNMTIADVYRAAEFPAKINIFRLNTSEIKSRLLCDLRVSAVDVHRQFPATIVISLTERNPLAYVANDFGFVQLDKQGVVLVALKNIKQMNVPIITGVQLGSIYVGDKVEEASVKNVLAYLAALDPPTLNQFSEININSSGVLTAYTINDIVIRLGNSDRLTEKAKVTCDILRDIGDKKTAVEYIDLNYASPYIKIRQ